MEQTFPGHLCNDANPGRKGHHCDPALTFDGKGHLIDSVDFDYDEIDKRLGWEEPKDPAEVARDQRFTDAADLLEALGP